ncbi:hypothetical protein [Clostridium estertheticum]|uniref:hypothetical protein n=1 Tax=Clostridium estertheticum TaxID=238834 RepID=UPI001CF5CD8B|nr:hypothetical protein [Clostridium estertheticum]MCB2353540.1 hypothetical protein [Clostridium estertheticum]WAG41875.1 hypothetical protein LL065_03975 [Clostridium estertheticum]
MKKMISVVLIVLLVLPLSACGTNKSADASKTSSKVSSTETKKSTIPYAKEISYLPAYDSAMKAKTFIAANKNNKSSMGVYTIKSTTSDKVFLNYEKILKGDGWKIYQSIKAHSISAKKGTHDTTIMIQQLKNDVNLTITSK